MAPTAAGRNHYTRRFDRGAIDAAEKLVSGYSHLAYDLSPELGDDATDEQIANILKPVLENAIWAAIADHVISLMNEDLAETFSSEELHGTDFLEALVWQIVEERRRSA